MGDGEPSLRSINRKDRIELSFQRAGNLSVPSVPSCKTDRVAPVSAFRVSAFQLLASSVIPFRLPFPLRRSRPRFAARKTSGFGRIFGIVGCPMWHGHLAHVWRALRTTGETPVPLSATFAKHRQSGDASPGFSVSAF